MAKSLARRLWLWQAATLSLVVSSLGLLVYFSIDRATFRQIDTELEAQAQLLATTLGALNAAERSESELALSPQGVRIFLPPADRPPPPPGTPQRRESPRPRDRQDLAYFIVWDQRGRIWQHSPNAPTMAYEDVPVIRDETTVLVRPRRDHREAFVSGPDGSVVMVGQSVRREFNELAGWRWLLLGSGLAAVILGTVGGTIVLRRSLRPLAQMSETAAGITAENLAARIETHNIDMELATLATTLNAAFDRLEADFHHQARFAADASHELRTPLTIILGQIELALTQGTCDDTTREALLASQRAARRMKSLAEQLLLLARADAGKLLPDRTAFDFGEVVQECLDLLQPLAREKQVEFASAIKPVEYDGDPALMSQVVINLVSNAILHNQSGGQVRVTLTSDHQGLQLQVADTGPGIASHELPRLFERFYRADAARSRASGGAGLGLAIVQSIVRAHGGEIRCTSVEGEGSEFTVRLPQASNTVESSG